MYIYHVFEQCCPYRETMDNHLTTFFTIEAARSYIEDLLSKKETHKIDENTWEYNDGDIMYIEQAEPLDSPW